MARTFTLNGRITRRSLKRAYSINSLVYVTRTSVIIPNTKTRRNATNISKKGRLKVGTSRAASARASLVVAKSRRHRTATAAAPRSIYFVCVRVCVFNCE